MTKISNQFRKTRRWLPLQFTTVGFSLILSFLTSVQAAPAKVSFSGLLNEMVSRDAAATWPSPSFNVKQASSYDRSRVEPDKPGWFGNRDGSNYLRSETNEGRRELVMMESDAPGALVRFHLTNGGPLNAVVRLYLDGAASPTLSWPTADLMDNDLRLGSPLVSRQPPPGNHGSATLYLPIPYAKGCKVTLEEKDPEHAPGRYYHIDYRSYPPGTQVQSFSLAQLETARPQMEKLNQTLNHPPRVTGNTKVAKEQLAPGASLNLELPAGSRAVQQLELTVGGGLSPALREQVLRSVVLRATFDEEIDAIWCPVGDFMGSGAGAHPLRSWFRDVDESGHSVSRWVMPYRRKTHFSLQNLGALEVPVAITAITSPWDWTDRSLYFHANWHQEVNIPSEPPRDWNFVTIQGRGVMVGDVMSVFNPIPSWYGEGNEKIWVDRESFPSHIGTGSEDYYNASWAPNPVYQTPFTNHPRMDEEHAGGQNVYTRSRHLDGVPFEKSLRFDFEIMTWKPSEVDYSATTYWYGAPGSKATLVASPAEVQRPIRTLTPPLVLPGAFELEHAVVLARSPGLVVEPQDMSWAQGTWSGRSQLLIRGKKVGDFVEIAIPTGDNQPKRLTLYATGAFDYGTLKFSVNGQPLTQTFDGYAPNPTPLLSIPLGVWMPLNGRYVLRAEVVGANAKSGGDRFFAALDALVLSK